MLELSVHNIVLGVAVLLVIAGIAGLAPGVMIIARRRRLLSNLAALRPEDYQAPALYERESRSEQALLPETAAQDQALPLQTFRTQVLPATLTAPSSSDDAGLAQPPLAGEGGGREEEAPDEIEEELVEDQAGDEDDFLSLFRATSVQSTTPVALTEAFERVSAADLLAQARELRDLLRKAA